MPMPLPTLNLNSHLDLKSLKVFIHVLISTLVHIKNFRAKNCSISIQELNESYVPYVVETSIGLDRMFLAMLSNAYKEEQLEDGTERVVLMLPPVLAPVKAAVLPLVAKDGLPEKARQIMDSLKFDFNCQYEEKDSIGKRYRRQDAIGTPFCITVDHQTTEDNTVTIRDRDTMKQERIDVALLHEIIAKKIRPDYQL
jgi:glycyl-tRNA synthetase